MIGKLWSWFMVCLGVWSVADTCIKAEPVAWPLYAIAMVAVTLVMLRHAVGTKP